MTVKELKVYLSLMNEDREVMLLIGDKNAKLSAIEIYGEYLGLGTGSYDIAEKNREITNLHNALLLNNKIIKKLKKEEE
jgi:hypothetical protein